MFNFPHIGGKMKIHKNRELLFNFFKSSSKKLTNYGTICVSLCEGQSGTSVDKPRVWNDTWQLINQSSNEPKHFGFSRINLQ